jgi:hypothetical protein
MLAQKQVTTCNNHPTHPISILVTFSGSKTKILMNGTHFNDMGHNKRHMIEHPKQKSQGGLPRIFQGVE